MSSYRARLITIPISHYCEKARWALDRAGIEYVEEGHLQAFHFLPAYRAGGADSVPVLVTNDGVFNDSTLILKWVDSKLSADAKLYPENVAVKGEIESLEEELDEGFGPAGRLWMYAHCLDRPELFREFLFQFVPKWERAVFPVAALLMKPYIRHELGITSRSITEALKTIEASLDAVARRLSDGRKFLLGDRFTAADLTFAALSAPVTLPLEYGVRLPELTQLPAIYAKQVSQWRSHPAAQFALKVYRENRTSKI